MNVAISTEVGRRTPGCYIHASRRGHPQQGAYISPHPSLLGFKGESREDGWEDARVGEVYDRDGVFFAYFEAVKLEYVGPFARDPQ